MILRLISTSLLLTSFCLAQNKNQLIGDCADATEIAPKGVIRFDSSPIGFGKKLEIKGNPINSPYFFQREENTAWFWFDALSDDMLTFKIYPKDTAADFDFLLFRYTDENFCEDILDKRLRPIRSNISRYNVDVLSMTGLSAGSDEEFVPAGPGNHLSKAITTQKGERYYLVINNVYSTETSFSISFDYYTTTDISGEVKDEETDLQIGDAVVTWEEKTGEVLAETRTDPETGKYSFKVPIKKGNHPWEYILSVSEPLHFFSEQKVTATSSKPPQPLVSVLPQLKKGKRMVLKNINFYGDKAVPLPSSKPSFKRLLRLMKANDSLIIGIEGHTNGCNKGFEFSQQLSTNRAKMVRSFLTKSGIDSSRVSAVGLNCSQMLYPNAKSEKEQSLNRRVEFVVNDF